MPVSFPAHQCPGIPIFCADCGSRLTFSHNTTRRKLADGTVKLYKRDCYRCYRKINARESCSGQSSYCADTINETVLYEIRRILSIIKQKPEAALLEKAKEKNMVMCTRWSTSRQRRISLRPISR